MNKERPILFSAPMVRAILDGRKTQTRRVIKPQPFIDKMGNFCWKNGCYGQSSSAEPRIQAIASPIPFSHTKRVLCPYGKPGDQLWVRETLKLMATIERNTGEHGIAAGWAAGGGGQTKIWEGRTDRELIPSIHCPRKHSRIDLLITGVRVERLQDISEGDAIREGLINKADHTFPIWTAGDGFKDHFEFPIGAFRELWEKINGAESWDANPFVWVIEFEPVKP